MDPIGPKIAEGRDSEIYDHGPGKVLRVTREQRSLTEEAEVMSYARSQGYPVPEVFDAGDGYLVMERVDGPTMLADAIPFRIRRAGKTLAGLHEQLHRIEAPSFLTREAPVPGDRLVHGDLHPLNVLMGPEGPVVVDWTNACRGAPEYDVADTWVLFSCADPPINRFEALFAPLVRKGFLRSFLRDLDRESARSTIPSAVAHRLTDRNMTEPERERMQALARWASEADTG